MLQRELSFLTLLVLLCQHGVKATDLEKCDPDPAVLTCGEGTIKVNSIFYGRDDTTTCPDSSRPASYFVNTLCSSTTALSEISAGCDGKTFCMVIPYNFFTDPCPGTYKYMRVTYECVVPTTAPPTTTPPPIPSKREIICQDRSSAISCEHGRSLYIEQANYGRRDKVTCPSPRATVLSTPCISSQTTNLQNRCNGKGRCQLHAANTELPNRCPNIDKYLEVTYRCE